MPRPFIPYSLNIQGQLVPLDRPLVMGILNATPDSFFEGSRTPASHPDAIRLRVREIIAHGGEIIDVGAYSTRPGAADISPDEEWRRLEIALRTLRDEAPTALVSVDTFRAEVAKRAVEEYGVQMINDISAGMLDRAMLRTAARLGVPYIMMHMQGEPRTMQTQPHYHHVVAEVIEHLARRLQKFYEYGGKDAIVDPGFGFGKTLEHNYQLMEHLTDFHELNCPLLVGISRKSMIYRLLDTTPSEALNGTTVLNAFALLRGAHILRVHDVEPAVEACRIVQTLHQRPFPQIQ